MQRNNLYLLVGVLVALVLGLGLYILYQESQKPGLEIRVDGNGIKIDGK